MLSCRQGAVLLFSALALLRVTATSSSPVTVTLRGSKAHNDIPGARPHQLYRRGLQSLWSNSHNLVHVLQTKWMQHQSALLDLGEARLAMMKTVTIPSLEAQSSSDYLWIIWTTPRLDADLKDELIAELADLSDNVVLLGYPGRVLDDFRSFDISDVEEDMVWYGSYQRLLDYHEAAQSHLLVDTRLDGNDALAETFIAALQTQASQELDGADPDEWRVLCAKHSWEWRYYDDTNSKEFMCTGRLVDLEHVRFCVNSGLTVVYEVDADIGDLPTKQQCNMHEEIPLCQDAEPDAHKCISKIDLMRAVFRPRTAADAGMKHVYPDYENPVVTTCGTQAECWDAVEAQFPFDDLEIQNMRVRMEENMEDIIKDAIEGQCTTGHSCIEKSMEDLKKLLDEFLYIPSQCLNLSPTISPKPTDLPTFEPTFGPTEGPTITPSHQPSATPTKSSTPTLSPSSMPSRGPTFHPTVAPSDKPSVMPSDAPSLFPYALLLSGRSTLVEDQARLLGPAIHWERISNYNDELRDDAVSEVAITGFPVDATLKYTDINSVDQTVTVPENYVLEFAEGTETQIRDALDTLTVKAPAESDEDFVLTVTVAVSTTAPLENNSGSYDHPVSVTAVADKPDIDAPLLLQMPEDTSVPLVINADSSGDDDNSETLTIDVEIPADNSGAVGTLEFSNVPDSISVADFGGGKYTISATGSDPAAREAILDAFTTTSISFAPRPQWSGIFRHQTGIKVTAVSTENANGADLADADSERDGTVGDEDTKIETYVTYVDIVVEPVLDFPEGNDAATVNENNGSSDPSDPTLIVSLTAAEFGIDDTDGSQSLDLTITGFPLDAPSITIDDVADVATTQESDESGATTITVSGEADAVLSAISSIDVEMLDDSDKNFALNIVGTVSDTNGETTVSAPVDMKYSVIVKAVADKPKVEGPGEQPIVDENSDFKLYPFDIALTDTDGSEAIRRVEILVSSRGSPGVYSLPLIQIPNETLTIKTKLWTKENKIRYTVSGPDDDLIAALAALEVKPGAHNGEDVRVNIKTVSEEKYPSERNSPHGGGKKGSEILVSTASEYDEIIIPVQPVVEETPVAIHPMVVNGTEDLRFLFPSFAVELESKDGTFDTDGSQTKYIELLNEDVPNRGFFYRSDGRARASPEDGWLRLQEHWYEELLFEGGPHYSGFFNLTVRAAVIDTRRDGLRTATRYSEESNIEVYINPVVDPITSQTVICYSEDTGRRSFGTRIVRGIQKEDRAKRTGNNPEPETITKMTIDLDYEGPSGLLEPDVGEWTAAMSAPMAGVGSANVTYDDVTKTFIVTSSILDGLELVTSSIDERLEAEQDILATIDQLTIEYMKEHTSENPVIKVGITALDVNNGVMSEDVYESLLTVNFIGEADTPGLSVSGTTTVFEDGDSIDISAVATNSADVDGSETTSVRITVPFVDGVPLGTVERKSPVGSVLFSDLGSGVYEIKSAAGDSSSRIAEINDLLQTGLVFNPKEDWAGTLTGENGLKVTVISTEADESAEEAVCGLETEQKASVSLYIPITVEPVADYIVELAGNARGYEDIQANIPVRFISGDLDGSETLSMEINADSVPDGAVLLGANNQTLPLVDGKFKLTPADIEDFSIIPPLHYSSALSGEIELTGTGFATDGEDVSSLGFTMPIYIVGIADTPTTKVFTHVAEEDELYCFGEAITGLDDVLVDQDGSETLTYLLSGIPLGVFPQSEHPDGVNYVGNRKFMVDYEAMQTLCLPPITHFSGENPYPSLSMKATTQEMDGDQASSDWWDIEIDVLPVIDGKTIDGLKDWSPVSECSEGGLESGDKIDLSVVAVAEDNYVDYDGSEVVLSYTFDFTNFIRDSLIEQRLKDLDFPFTGTLADVGEFVTRYVKGTYDFDSFLGAVTVSEANIGTMYIEPEPFLDLNLTEAPAKIPVTALTEDSAVINGLPVTEYKTDVTDLVIVIANSPDVPTVFAENAEGEDNNITPLSLGGASTDTDIELGRPLSETVEFAVKFINGTGSFAGTDYPFTFVNTALESVGFDFNDGNYYFTQTDLKDINLFVERDISGLVTFELTSIAFEPNVTLYEENSTLFTVLINDVGSGPPVPLPTLTPPLPPIMTSRSNNGVEDEALFLDLTVEKNPDDETNPRLTVTFPDLPEGFEVVGRHYKNPITGRVFADAEDVNHGLVGIRAPKDFSGSISVALEIIARNLSKLAVSSGPLPVEIYFDPVADAPSIAMESDGDKEDETIGIDILLEATDIDGSEVVGDYVYIKINNNADLDGNYQMIDSPADLAEGGSSTIVGGSADGFGLDVQGYYEVPVSDLGSLSITPDLNWHGTFTFDVIALSEETEDDSDGDHVIATSKTFEITLTAVADEPLLSGPTTLITAPEDTPIQLVGLSAALFDTVEDNGPELLSVAISGAPDGSSFQSDNGSSKGTNIGDGSWSFHVSDLSTLHYVPPMNYAGPVTLVLEGFTIESSTQSEAASSYAFNLNILPVADDYLTLGQVVDFEGDQQVVEPGTASTRLNIRMDDNRGVESGEVAPELITLTFRDVPAGVFFTSPLGGRLVGNTFTGTAEQANALRVNKGPGTEAVEDVVRFTSDSIDVGSTGLYFKNDDKFVLLGSAPHVAGVDVTAELDGLAEGGVGFDVLRGNSGNETLIGNDGSDQFFPGAGQDTMTGGNGIDIFSWSGVADISTFELPDIITDFEVGPDGDQLDFTNLVSPFNAQTVSLNEYVTVTQNDEGLDVYLVGQDLPVVRLEGVTASLDDLIAGGNILA